MSFAKVSVKAGLLIAAALSGGGFLLAQSGSGSGDQIRDAFIRTRPTSVKQARPVVARNKSPKNRPTAPASLEPLGLGYTLYARNPQGRPERVDPRRVFNTGDEIRFVVEANQDAYLYVFNADSKGALRMIYPHARLQNGDNFIQGHVPYQIPSAKEPDPEAQWFAFLTPGEVREKIFFVLSRSPLPDVPTNERLIQAVRQSGQEVWMPPGNVWARVETAMEQPVKRTIVRQELGRLQSPDEALAITREIGLRPNVAAPSVIHLNESTTAGALVVGLELVKQ
ncbi:DUF4384 domain-containing protein [Chloracidobacterium sp. MS 40/45]|jgi:hypothetical protein|uniref:DUF4384 domain-containing protein n=1 Tax=Chloracidobacterium aggregatum TaxID=2851959 RepID=UPI001B8D8519|nr:DUF4384 domain-containing protein [Chloracidobacterium aggregatum]QUW01773.1 DUF4384 domain-containing protein [Chloracidobacterium sp. MS 40/45]